MTDIDMLKREVKALPEQQLAGFEVGSEAVLAHTPEALDVAHRPTGEDYNRHHEPGKLRLSGLPRERRHLFRLRHPEQGEGVAGERQLNLEGTPNFRDFGGYETDEGRRVKWGKLYRSGQLSSLTERDLELLDALDIDLVCDFRR